jgi:hypothetical protein
MFIFAIDNRQLTFDIQTCDPHRNQSFSFQFRRDRKLRDESDALQTRNQIHSDHRLFDALRIFDAQLDFDQRVLTLESRHGVRNEIHTGVVLAPIRSVPLSKP